MCYTGLGAKCGSCQTSQFYTPTITPWAREAGKPIRSSISQLNMFNSRNHKNKSENVSYMAVTWFYYHGYYRNADRNLKQEHAQEINYPRYTDLYHQYRRTCSPIATFFSPCLSVILHPSSRISSGFSIWPAPSSNR